VKSYAGSRICGKKAWKNRNKEFMIRKTAGTRAQFRSERQLQKSNAKIKKIR